MQHSHQNVSKIKLSERYFEKYEILLLKHGQQIRNPVKDL